MDILQTLSKLAVESGFAGFFAAGGWKNLIMIAVACVLLYLGIGKKFEPLLMVGIAFGVLLTNIPGGGLYHMGMWDSYVYEAPYDVMYDYALYNKAETRAYTQEEFTYYVYARACGHSEAEIEAYFEDHKASGSDIYTDVMNLMASPDFDQSLVERLQADEKGETEWEVKNELSFTDIIHLGGLLDILYIGVKAGIYPCLIFIGIGAMTDFGPLISRPSSLILGAAAQLGVFLAFFGAVAMGFTGPEAGSIGIIGGADGPTAILTTSKLAPHLLGPIAIAAYSYMALIPLIQPPIMRALTTKKEREVKMEQTRPVSKVEKIVFPILVATFIILLIPSTAPLIGCLMFGNLLRETGCTDRLSDTAQNALMNIVTLFLGISVGATTVASRFLNLQTLMIIALGLIAFSLSTVGGLLVGKLMYVVTGGKVNPLIGSAGVSAVPMAARVAQVEGQKANPSNFLLMHAMGPNVAGVIGSAIAAGFLLKIFGA